MGKNVRGVNYASISVLTRLSVMITKNTSPGSVTYVIIGLMRGFIRPVQIMFVSLTAYISEVVSKSHLSLYGCVAGKSAGGPPYPTLLPKNAHVLRVRSVFKPDRRLDLRQNLRLSKQCSILLKDLFWKLIDVTIKGGFKIQFLFKDDGAKRFMNFRHFSAF